MSGLQDPDTEELLAQIRQGDQSAVSQLLARHRHRLRKMVSVRMDRRLSARADPSDVVQESLAIASRRLTQYVHQASVPFYVWLRRIAWEQLVTLHRRHVLAGKRDIRCESPLTTSDDSASYAADQLDGSGSGPLKRIMRDELAARIHAYLAQLSPADREIILMRHWEQLTHAECAAVLGIKVPAAMQRYVRALHRLHQLLGDASREGGA